MKRLSTLLESGACRGSTKVPLDERPILNRKQLGPLVRGYVDAMLEDYPLHDINDIDEATLQQMVRDCVGFYWRHRAVLECVWVDPEDYGERETGRELWLSRNGQNAFGDHNLWFVEDDPVWVILQAGAQNMGPFTTDTTPDGQQIRFLHFFEGRWYQ